MLNINSPIQQGLIVRVVLTLGVIPVLLKIDIDPRITLWFALIILDRIDFWSSKLIDPNVSSHTHEYQIGDKIVDILSYWYVYELYPFDSIYLYLLIYRTIGVILFSLTRNVIWLTVMFDAVKEMLVYRYLFEENNTYLPLMIIGVVIFEVIHSKFGKKLSFVMDAD